MPRVLRGARQNLHKLDGEGRREETVLAWTRGSSEEVTVRPLQGKVKQSAIHYQTYHNNTRFNNYWLTTPRYVDKQDWDKSKKRFQREHPRLIPQAREHMPRYCDAMLEHSDNIKRRKRR